MKCPKLGANSAVFILFFGLALIEAFRGQNIWEIIVFLALGLFSLWIDIRKK